MMRLSGVFFVGDLKKSIVKIGVSNNVKIRLKDLNRKYDYDLKILCVIDYGDSQLKQRLKEVFKRNCKRGDWFYYNGKLKEFIDEILFLKETKDYKGFDQLVKETIKVDYEKELLKMIGRISRETGGAVPIAKVVYEMWIKYEDQFRSDPERILRGIIYSLMDKKVLCEPIEGFVKFC